MWKKFPFWDNLHLWHNSQTVDYQPFTFLALGLTICWQPDTITGFKIVACYEKLLPLNHAFGYC